MFGLTDQLRAPVECIVRVRGREITELYPHLISVTVDSNRTEAAVAQLEFETRRDATGSWPVQDARVFVPWAQIEIHADFGGRRQQVFDGYVREVQVQYPPIEGDARVQVSCQDRSFALDREHVRKLWGSEDAPTDDSAILRAITASHGLTLHERSAEGETGLVLHQDETDAAFVRRRAQQNGFESYVAGDILYFGPMQLDADPQPSILVYAGPDSSCAQLNVSIDGHRPERIALDVEADDGSVETRELEPRLPMLGAESPLAADGLSPFVWRMSRELADETELAPRAQGLVDALSMRVRAEGELDGAIYGYVLAVGRPVGVDGLGDWLSGIYYVDHVLHEFNSDGYSQSITLLRNALGDNLSSGVSSVLAEVLA